VKLPPDKRSTLNLETARLINNIRFNDGVGRWLDHLQRLTTVKNMDRYAEQLNLLAIFDYVVGGLAALFSFFLLFYSVSAGSYFTPPSIRRQLFLAGVTMPDLHSDCRSIRCLVARVIPSRW
jgi:hypothetical protein